ncbi:MAG: hypothetical protein Q8Q85_01600 [Gemmatimonadales bacterium]|nr:hypothetical protein [Gemmatimonadales bacterium]
MKQVFSVLAGVLIIAGFVPYIWAILRKGAKPVKATWIIWITLDTITLAGMIVKGTVNGQLIGAMIGVSIVVGLALKFGSPGWTRLDRFCLGGAALGIALWALTRDPIAGIATSCAVLFLGSIPTFVSAWEDPNRESTLAWTFYWCSCVFAIAAIPQWTIADALQPITFAVTDTTAMAILLVRPRMLARQRKLAASSSVAS